MRRRSDGETVTAEDVLSSDELADYYRGRRSQPATGFEHLSLGADPAVVAWEQAMGSAR